MYGKHGNLWLVIIVALIVFGGIALLEGPITVTGNVVADVATQPPQPVQEPTYDDSTLGIPSKPTESTCRDVARGTVEVETADGTEQYSTYCDSEQELLVVSCTGAGKLSYTAIRCPLGTTCVNNACI